MLAQRTGDVTSRPHRTPRREADPALPALASAGTAGANAIVLPTSQRVASGADSRGAVCARSGVQHDGTPPTRFLTRCCSSSADGHRQMLARPGRRARPLGEPLGRAFDDLLDWLGNSAFDPGFDQLLRTTDAGRVWLAQVASLIGPTCRRPVPWSISERSLRPPARPLPYVGRQRPGIQPAALTITRADGTAASAGPRRCPADCAARQRRDAARNRLGRRSGPARHRDRPAAGTFDLGCPASSSLGQSASCGSRLCSAGGVVRIIMIHSTARSDPHDLSHGHHECLKTLQSGTANDDN